jgi:hypothetical protein
MAYLGVTASTRSLALADAVAGPLPDSLPDTLAAALARLAPRAPVVVLVHGYKFDPFHPARNPHSDLFTAGPRNWTDGLGLADPSPEAGLGIGFAWPAAAAHLPHLLTTRRTGFAHVYDRAAGFGARLAELVALLQVLAPERPVDILAHSLGARVALAALPHLGTPPGRMILLGAAEFDSRARAFLAAAPAAGPAIYNVTARANDFYDAMFETFAPRSSWSERALGLGLTGGRPNWLDLQLDRAEVTAWLNARGIPLEPARARLCHRSFYTRRGTFALYRAILRRAPGWDLGTLRAEPCLAAQEPRWSRLRPPRATGPAPGLVPGLRNA